MLALTAAMSHNASTQLAAGVIASSIECNVASTREDMTVISNFSVCRVLLSFETWGNTYCRRNIAEMVDFLLKALLIPSASGSCVSL